MRFLIIVFMLFGFQKSNGQVLCDTVDFAGQFGDYPPGCTLCYDFLVANNIGYTPDTINYDFPCGGVENSVWYSFYGADRAVSVVRIFLGDCTLNKGVEMAVYDENLNRVSDCFSSRAGTEFALTLPDRQLYYLMVDGIDGDECEFGLLISQSPGFFSDDIYETPANANYCVGAEVCFERGRDEALEIYEWEIPVSDSIVSGGINEEEICIHFKTTGPKDISLKVKGLCQENEYSKTILVRNGEALAIESFTPIREKICLGVSVQFKVVWNNNDVGLNWIVPAENLTRINGGGTRDTSLIVKAIGTGDVSVFVTPDDFCGLPHEFNFEINSHTLEVINGIVCGNGCYPVGDSCYRSNNGNAEFVMAGLNSNGCDSTVLLSVESFEIFPSPNIDCRPMNGGLLIEWQDFPSVDEYVIFANRDSITTVVGDSYFLENNFVTSPLVIKVQPKGECTYLPAEIDCSEFFTQTSSSFLDEQISIFPNPTTGNLNIETDLQIEEILIFDATGRFLQKESTTAFELKNRKSGIYFLKIKTNEGVGIKRVLVSLD